MRPNINRYKRKDFTALVRPRQHAVKPHSLDGLKPTPKVYKQEKPAKTEPTAPVVTPEASKERSAVSLNFSLPTFRQPPSTEEAPSTQSWRMALIVVLGLAFFIFGYHNLRHMLHS